MDIEEAKVILKEFNKDYEKENGIGDLAEGIAEMVVDWNDNEAIETVLSELEKKDKIIYNLAFALADYVMYYEYDKCRNPEMIKNKAKEKIEYFTNKVEEDK